MNLKVRHNSQVKTIALYNGLAPNELSSILQAVFLLTSASIVVGFLSPEVSWYDLIHGLRIYTWASGILSSISNDRIAELSHDCDYGNRWTPIFECK